MKIKSWLIYWGARMQQIAASFERPGIQVCLAETVHAAWKKLGMTSMSLGAAVLFDLSTSLRSQVRLHMVIISSCSFCARAHLEMCSCIFSSLLSFLSCTA